MTVTWTRNEKPQPPGAKFKVPATNAPNVNGARDLGYAVGQGNDGLPDLAELRTAVEAGRVKARVRARPGSGRVDRRRVVARSRRAGAARCRCSIVQGVVMTPLAQAADIVLPGAAFVEKDAIYTNDQGRVQAASRVIAPPGEAREDWQILANVAKALGLALPYKTSERRAAGDSPRRCRARRTPRPTRWCSRGPIPARNWLQASNPSERWKWDFMFQDLPPVKGHSVQMEGLPLAGRPYIPLKPVGTVAGIRA